MYNLKGANADFEKLSSMGLSNYGERYDYFSIMHCLFLLNIYFKIKRKF